MSQETEVNTPETQEMTETQEVNSGETEPSAQPEERIPVSALQEERERRRAIESELHELRSALLRNVNAAPQQDPIESALGRIAKNSDPDVFKVLAPTLRPLLEELHGLRQVTAEQQSALQYFAQRDREREAHSQLSTLIPDLPQIGGDLLKYVQKLPGDVQKMYADNPALFVPLAEAVRTMQKGNGKAVQAARAATTMDTAGTGARNVNPPDPTENMKPGSKEFEAFREAFWGRRA